MAEHLPCFQSGFDFLNVENCDHIYFISARASPHTKSVGKNISDTLGCASCATFFVLTTF